MSKLFYSCLLLAFMVLLSCDKKDLIYSHTVNLIQSGELEQAFIKSELNHDISNLIISGEALNELDFTYIRTRLTNLSTLNIINSKTTIITDGAFTDYVNLVTIDLPTGLTVIGDFAFNNCYKLSTVTLINSSQLTTIGDHSFYGCLKLTAIIIGDNSPLTTIGDGAFIDCTSLTSITFGHDSQLNTIGVGAFKNCGNLINVIFGNNSHLTTISINAFINCSDLTTLNIPASVTTIGDYAFYDTGLTTIKYPSSLITINAGSVKSCSDLTTIDIPSSITDIGRFAFSNCSRLTKIYCRTTTPPTLGFNSFSNTNNAPIYVPSESVNSYKNNYYWTEYANRIYPIP